jgi:hypothetical protein
MTSGMRKISPVIVAALAAAISVAAYDYAFDKAVRATRMREHHEVVSGVIQAPIRYRVLVPMALEPVIAAAATSVARETAFTAVYAAYYAAALFAIVLTLFVYTRRWFSDEQALAGALLVACTVPIALRYHTFAPWSLLEPALLTLGLTWIAERRDERILPLTIVASLNRETALLIPLALAIDALHDRPWPTRRLAIGAAGIAASLAIFLGLRWARGWAPPLVTIADVWAMNVSTAGIKTAIPAVALFLGVTGWWLAARGLRRMPAVARRMLWLGAIYLPAYLLFGYWYEVRLLMPLYPVLLPTVLSGIYVVRPSDAT